jgi:5'-AMP-activated protein kinase catalytic alpha subunit
MKALNLEWKTVNPFQVRVRRRNPVSGQYSKMMLQLYQVDFKSYLLDFKSLNSKVDEDSDPTLADPSPSPSTSYFEPHLTASSSEGSSLGETGTHHTMEFFEMCAALITQLAR